MRNGCSARMKAVRWPVAAHTRPLLRRSCPAHFGSARRAARHAFRVFELKTRRAIRQNMSVNRTCLLWDGMPCGLPLGKALPCGLPPFTNVAWSCEASSHGQVPLRCCELRRSSHLHGAFGRHDREDVATKSKMVNGDLVNHFVPSPALSLLHHAEPATPRSHSTLF